MRSSLWFILAPFVLSGATAAQHPGVTFTVSFPKVRSLDGFNAVGMIPMSLVRWELTGLAQAPVRP